MAISILDEFISDDHFLKNKTSVYKLIISSHRMEMMNLSCEMVMDISIGFYKF